MDVIDIILLQSINLQLLKGDSVLFTCKHGCPQSLYPVAPHAETQQRLKAIEGPHPYLGHEVRREIQTGQH